MHGNRSKGSKKGRLLVGLVAAMGFTQGAVAASSLQCAATELSAPVSKIELMPDTLGVAVESAVNGQRYQILIHRPSATVKEPPGGFPVLYVLDGNATFVLAAQAAALPDRKQRSIRTESITRRSRSSASFIIGQVMYGKRSTFSVRELCELICSSIVRFLWTKSCPSSRRIVKEALSKRLLSCRCGELLKLPGR